MDPSSLFAAQGDFPVMDFDGVTSDQMQQMFQSGKGVWKNWYDFKLYDSVRLQPNVLLPASQVVLFQNAFGQQQAIFGTASTMYTKQLSDTNMMAAGQLPRGRFFIVHSIEVIVPLTGNLPTIATSGQGIELPTVQGISTNVSNAASDARVLLTLGYGYFYYGTKRYQEGQLLAFPCSEGISGWGFDIGATTGQTLQVDSIANNTINGVGPWCYQSCHGLQQQMNFNFTIQFFNPFTVIANSSQVIKVSLNGWLYDPVA